MSVNEEPPESTQQFNMEYKELVCGTLLGHGRFGRVYECQHYGKTVAVKDIAVSTKEITRRVRLMREAKIHMKLCHENIITLFTWRSDPQHLLLVLEFAAGGSLSDVLKERKRLEPTVVTKWTAQICNGMRYLHEQDIVHRDVKPSNILVLEKIDNSDLLLTTVKIADFGLASDGHYETRVMSEVGGTECFMAPEVRQPPYLFSKASDVYSFGVVVWNLLTGEPSEDIAKSLQVEKNSVISPFYTSLIKRCRTTEYKKRPSFEVIFRETVQWKQQNYAELAGVAGCNDEFGSVFVNLHGITPDHLHLKPDGKHLKGGSSLLDCDTTNKSTLRVVNPPLSKMQIFIKLPTGRTLTLQVELRDTIETVKMKIQHKIGTPPSNQLLTLGFLGKALQNDMNLSDYTIHNGSTLQLTQRLPPTM